MWRQDTDQYSRSGSEYCNLALCLKHGIGSGIKELWHMMKVSQDGTL